MIQWDDFTKVDIRCGTILTAEVFAKAKKQYPFSLLYSIIGIHNSSENQKTI